MSPRARPPFVGFILYMMFCLYRVFC